MPEQHPTMFKGLQHNPALTNIKFTTSVTQMKAAKQQENMAHNQGKKFHRNRPRDDRDGEIRTIKELV